MSYGGHSACALLLSLHDRRIQLRSALARQSRAASGTRAIPMPPPPADALKAIALANGFWHMGEFRTLYRDLFGETPQQTLETARRQ